MDQKYSKGRVFFFFFYQRLKFRYQNIWACAHWDEKKNCQLLKICCGKYQEILTKSLIHSLKIFTEYALYAGCIQVSLNALGQRGIEYVKGKRKLQQAVSK